LDVPGLRAIEVFEQAGTYVNEITHGEQNPIYQYSIYGNFYFNHNVKQ
jgi:hypothetical protein